MASTIGIKIANGEFYPVLAENTEAKKRLILTTVHDNQSGMQIDLYKSYAKSMAGALYIGSIAVEQIQPKLKGAPSIELIIHADREGVISAYAVDLDQAPQEKPFYLSVSLKSLTEESREEAIPDYALEQNGLPPPGLYEKQPVYQERSGSLPWVVLAAAAFLLISVGIWFFRFRNRPATAYIPSDRAEAPAPASGPSPPEPAGAQTLEAAEGPAPRPAPEAAGAAAPKPAQPAPAAAAQNRDVPRIIAPAPVPASGAPGTARRGRPPAPVSSYKVPAAIPRQGLAYTVRWGDTLWEISEAFYRTPWRYFRIARYNNIRNPNHIVAGTTIRIPPKN
jgi:hypothetical protein